MSNLEQQPHESDAGTAVALAPVVELVPGREVVLGGTRGMSVVRTLPSRDRRMVGAWCFIDHFGPEDVRGSGGMRVGPHPHTGLQTVTWLIDGEVRHTDSLGSDQLIRPGQLNLMTAGRAIAHAERTTDEAPAVLHGLQLWVALPSSVRSGEPGFEHHAALPQATIGDAVATVLMGELAGTVSPATAYTPIVGSEVAFASEGNAEIPLREEFEYGAVAIAGEPVVDGTPLPPGSLLYLGCGRSTLPISATDPARLFLFGGEPFAEEIVMWWNFIGRSHDDIVRMRSDWEAGMFGPVAYDGDPLPAPALPTTPLIPRGRHR